MIAEHVALGLERHHDDVVDRCQRPHEQNRADDCGARIGQVAAAARRPLHPLPRASDGGSRCQRCIRRYRAHSCVSVFLIRRIRMITSGISNGSADMTTATPRRGLARSKALRMPSVARRCVELAGPPPVTKVTELKSPSKKIVASRVSTRYRLARSGKLTWANLRSPVAPSTLAA